MKTSKILTALVLPAMLAACTAEDVVTTNNVAQSERPLLNKDFKLISQGEKEGVDSRFYMAGSSVLTSVWEDGDKYGAALIDVYDPAYPRNPEEWDVIPSLAGNIPFVYDAAADEWKAVASTGVGHYLFSFPYNVNDQNRAAVSWELPAIQELYGKDGKLDLNAVVNNYNKSVAAALLEENATSHAVMMRNLFAYPKFVVKFDNGLPINTVSQVVLELANGDDFATKGGYNHIEVANIFDEKTIAAKVGKDKEFETEEEYWASKQTTDFIIDGETVEGFGALSQYTVNKNNTSKYIVAKLPNNTKVTLDSDNNKCVEVRFMIPGDLMADGGLYSEGTNLKMYVYTNNGVYTINDVYAAIDFKSTTPAETKNRVFARNASYTLNLKKDAPAKATEELYIVSDVKDWNELVDKYGASTAYAGANALGIAVVGDNFTLNAAAKMPTKADFAVTTDISIEDNVTLKNVFVAANKVIVKEGATLNIADNTNDINKIENNGTLNFKKAVVSRATVVEMINTIDYVDNMPNATLNIEEDAEVAFNLYNKYDDKTLEFGSVYNNGILKVQGINDGTIENNGSVIINGNFTTYWKHTNNKPEDDPNYEEQIPTFQNNGTFVADGATYTNKGNFFNAATGNVSCAGGATGVFTNEGYAKVAKDGTFLITSNTGTIELDEINQAKWSLETAGGTILYVAKTADTSLDFSSSAVTKLVIGNQNMTITKTNKLNAVEMGKGTLTLPKFDATAENATTKINNTQLKGDLTLKGDVVIASESAKITGTLTINEEASLTINKNNSVYAGATLNWGAVLVAGAYSTGSTEANATKGEGIFKSTQGSTNNISFADPDANKKTAYSNALTAYVKKFVENTRDALTWENVDTYIAAVTANDSWIATEKSALETAYSNLYGTTKTAAQIVASEDIDALAASLKTATITAVNNAIDAQQTAKTNKLTTAWKNGAGYATIGEQEGVESVLAPMWEAYEAYLTSANGMITWTDAEGDLMFKNARNELKGTVKLAIASMIDEALAIADEDGEPLTPTTPALHIPAGSYIDASTKTSAVYEIVKTWINAELTSAEVVGLNEYKFDGVAASLDNIQNWVYLLSKDYNNLTLAEYRAQEIAIEHKSAVLAWEAPMYSDENLTALALLLDNAVVVGTAVEINAAIAAGQNVVMTENATISGALTVNDLIKIEMNNSTLEGSVTVGKDGNLTIEEGTIENKDEKVSGIISNGDLTLKNVNIESARHEVRV